MDGVLLLLDVREQRQDIACGGGVPSKQLALLTESTSNDTFEAAPPGVMSITTLSALLEICAFKAAISALRSLTLAFALTFWTLSLGGGFLAANAFVLVGMPWLNFPTKQSRLGLSHLWHLLFSELFKRGRVAVRISKQ